MSMNMQGFQSFSRFLYHFVLAKLATSSIRVKYEFTMVLNVVCEITNWVLIEYSLSNNFRHV